jgi:hypothetical protein
MNFKTHRQRGRARIALLASILALVILGITFANRTQTAGTPREARPVEPVSTHAYGSYLPEISPSAEPSGEVYHYHQ